MKFLGLLYFVIHIALCAAEKYHYFTLSASGHRGICGQVHLFKLIAGPSTNPCATFFLDFHNNLRVSSNDPNLDDRIAKYDSSTNDWNFQSSSTGSKSFFKADTLKDHSSPYLYFLDTGSYWHPEYHRNKEQIVEPNSPGGADNFYLQVIYPPSE